jgi:hypothetical protein
MSLGWVKPFAALPEDGIASFKTGKKSTDGGREVKVW